MCSKQVTAHASWALMVLPVFLFCPCVSEIISPWPQQAYARSETSALGSRSEDPVPRA